MVQKAQTQRAHAMHSKAQNRWTECMHAAIQTQTKASHTQATLNAHHREHTHAHPRMYTTHSLASKQSSPVTTKPTKSSLQIK